MGGIVYLVSGDAASAVACCIAGIFLDLDHIIDYLYHSNFKFTVKGFFHTCEGYRLKRFFLFLHSYEILILLWLIFLLRGRDRILLGVNIGYTAHLITDQFANATLPFTYFFTFRLLKAFKNVFRQNS